MPTASRLIRITAYGAIAAGIATPVLRRRRGVPKPIVTATTVAAPVALCVLAPRSRARDVATCMLQMWAYVAHYEMPNDDPDALRARVRIDYPVRIDRVLGLGELPGVRTQRRFGVPGRVRRAERVLVWTHWLWFFFPHGTVLYTLLRHRDRFEATAASVYGVFDIGLIGYWVLPTAPPWYAAQEGRSPAMRRMMLEYGEEFWGDNWASLYSVLGGNPLAAMPSLHFATSVMAARRLRDIGPLQGAAGWTYAMTLGVALVHLGEHYVVDLIAGYALAEAVRRRGPRAAPLLRAFAGGVQALESRARP